MNEFNLHLSIKLPSAKVGGNAILSGHPSSLGDNMGSVTGEQRAGGLKTTEVLKNSIIENNEPKLSEIPNILEDEELDSWVSSNRRSSVVIEEPVFTRKLSSKMRKFEKFKQNVPIKKHHLNACTDCGKFIVNFRCNCVGPHDQGQRIKVRRELKNQMNRLLKSGKIRQVYWTVDGKAYESLEDTVELVLLGYRATVNFRVLGGMMDDKEDIEENNNNVIPPCPPPMPPPLPVKPKKFKGYQAPKSVQLNGLKVLGSRNREITPNWAENRVKLMRAKNKNIVLSLSRSRKVDETLKLPTAGVNGTHYVASKPIYEGDPAFRSNIKSTLFEDQLQWARHSMTISNTPVVAVDPYIGNINVPDPIPDKINLVTQWSPLIKNIWIPLPEDYNSTFDYAFRTLNDDTMLFSFPLLGSYHVVRYPLNLRPMGENVLIFERYTLAEEQAFQMKFVDVKIDRDNLKTTVHVPNYLIVYAEQWFGGKNLTNFAITSYLNDFNKWWPKTANSVFERPQPVEVIAALFHAARKKQVGLFDIMGLNFDVLNLQHDNTKMLIELPKNRTIWSMLKTVAQWILPNEAFALAKEAFDNLRFMGFSKGLWEPLKQLFDEGVVFVLPSFITRLPTMKLFKWMNDRSAIVLEELLKCIPGVGLLITVKELFDDYRQGTLSAFGALTRIIFHNWQDLLPFWVRIATLPVRLVAHTAWNGLVKFVKKEQERIHKFVFDRREPPISEFDIVNHDSYFSRFPVSDPVEIPKQVENEPFVDMLTETWETNDNPVYITCTTASNNCAGQKTPNNLVSAYLKRNIQERPISELRFSVMKETDSLARYWKSMFDVQNVETLDWINAPNHGPKRALYLKAWNQFQIDQNIDYTSKLQLKYDEVVMKPMMRTIIAFDNSYVVNVAPTIAAISNAMKKTFNGYTNVSRSPLYTLHVLYATGMQAAEIAEIIESNNVMGSPEKPHYFLKVLGDDSALLRAWKCLCCDFSRYDSTQHTHFHELFRNSFTTIFNKDKIDMLRKAAISPTFMYHPVDKFRKYQVQTVGLKTGSVETSVSNTFITALSYATALEKSYAKKEDPFEFIPKYLKDSCGFLPKASIQNLATGIEFLKTIFIMQEDKIVAIPLLSSLAKMGKCLTAPRLIVPMSGIKTKSQIAVDFTLMQLRGKGNLQNVPGFKRWYKALANMGSPMLKPYRYSHYGAPSINGEFEVLTDTISTAYNARYGLDWKLIDQFFECIADVPKHEYPFTYSSTVVQRAIEVDYGLEE